MDRPYRSETGLYIPRYKLPLIIRSNMDKQELEQKVKEHVEKRKCAYGKMGTVDSE
jgi:hypothetical protein